MRACPTHWRASLSCYCICLSSTGDVVPVQDRTLLVLVVDREHLYYLKVNTSSTRIYIYPLVIPLHLQFCLCVQKTLTEFSFFICNSLRGRFHFDFSDRVFGKNQLRITRHSARGCLVPDTLPSNSRSVVLSMTHVQAIRACPVLASLKTLSSKNQDVMEGSLTGRSVTVVNACMQSFDRAKPSK